MGIFNAALDLASDVGFSVIKNGGRIAFGSGKAIIGVVTEDEELIADGLKTAGKGALYLGGSMLLGNSSDDDDDSSFDDFVE